MKKTLLVTTIVAAALSSGCSTNTTKYYWGSYEKLIYQSYSEPGSADPLTQIEKLTTDIEQAEAVGKPTPPGVHAHLGYMYILNGNQAQALASFTEEKTLFPESESFINGLLNKIKGN